MHIPTKVLLLSLVMLQKYATKAAFLTSRFRSQAIRSSTKFYTSKDENDEQQTEFLKLPEPSSDDIPTLKLGESMTFHHIGPIIVNVDGSTSRIGNWDEMSKVEQEIAWKRISARNQKRRDALLKKNQEDGEK